MSYPLGPFPPELVAEISSKSPIAYGKMLRVSKNVNRAIQRALPEVCESRISPNEIYQHLKDARGDLAIRFSNIDEVTVSLFKLRGPAEIVDERPIIYGGEPEEFDIESPEFNFENRGLSDLEKQNQIVRVAVDTDEDPSIIDLRNEMVEGPAILDLLLDIYNRGYRYIDMANVYLIYRKRRRCQAMDRAYALRKSFEVLRERINEFNNYIRSLKGPVPKSVYDHIERSINRFAEFTRVLSYQELESLKNSLGRLANLHADPVRGLYEEYIKYIPSLEELVQDKIEKLRE